MSTNHKIVISQTSSASGKSNRIEINELILNGATIGQINLKNPSAQIESDEAFLKGVKAILEIEFTLDYWLNAQNVKHKKLGSLEFPFSFSDVNLVDLENININLSGTLRGLRNITLDLPRISNVYAKAGSLNNFGINKLSLPDSGFQISDISLGGINLSNIGFESGFVDKLHLEEIELNDAVIPSINIPQIQISSTPINIESLALSFDASQPEEKFISFNVLMVGCKLSIKPVLSIEVDKLILKNSRLSGKVDQIDLQDIHLPIKIQDLRLNELKLKDLKIKEIQLQIL